MTPPRLLLSLLAFACLGGCGRFDTDYGASDGFSGTQSINGFGSFRTSLEFYESMDLENTPEIETRNIMRLSSRSFRSDAIVWVPTSWPVSNLPEVTAWMNTWLSSGGKTLVVIVPDHGSTGAYYREATTLAPPEQRLEYRRRNAKQTNDRWLRESERKDFVIRDWFRAVPLPYELELGNRQWINFDLQAFDSTQSKATASVKNVAKPNGNPVDAPEKDDAVQWISSRVESLPDSGPVSSVTTLAEMTRPSWSGSRLIVISGGALVTNYAMTEESARRLTRDVATRLCRQAVDDPSVDDKVDVGFMETDLMPVAVSNASPTAPVATGMELLTTWPLSLVTIHLVFFGIVVCIMLIPGFGRPRSVRYNQPSRFSNHLDAMASLMLRGSGKQSNGQLFARQRISQYLRTVRGETSGPWLIDEPPPSELRAPDAP